MENKQLIKFSFVKKYKFIVHLLRKKITYIAIFGTNILN